MTDQLEQYYRENFGVLCKSMANRVGSLYDAEDVIQEAFLRALRYVDSFDPERSEMSTWFGKIARRAMFDFKRQETLQGLVREEQSGEEPVFDFRELGVSTAHEIEKEIVGRRENHRDILFLAYVRGYRPREIVEVVNDSARNVKAVLDRFKAEMASKYGV